METKFKMAQQVFRVFKWTLSNRTAYVRGYNIGTVQKALIPAFFMQQTSRTMASNTSSYEPVMLTKSLDHRPVSKINSNRNLVVLFSWMLAKTRHLQKYDNFYKKQGFDVLIVRLTPWQLLWPTKGSQLIALDVLNFLFFHKHYESIVIHGFSVGGYLFGEVLVKMKQNKEKYEEIEKKIVGQIFDSVVDYYGIPNGLSKAITQNKLLQNTLQVYISYHMRTFYEVATKHYLLSSETYHETFLRCPALFFFSKDDPVATPEGCLRVIEKWRNMGLTVFYKCFDSSPHVSHFMRHQDEYLAHLNDFMKRIGYEVEPYRQKSKL